MVGSPWVVADLSLRGLIGCNYRANGSVRDRGLLKESEHW